MFYRKHERHFAPVEHINPETGEVTSPKRRVKQSFRDECDINNILKTYKKSGIIQHVSAHAARFENLPDNIEFQEALEITRKAQVGFAALPSKVRTRFENDPAQFLAFMSNPDSLDEMRDLGLARPKTAPPAPEIAPLPPQPEAAPPAATASAGLNGRK